MPFLSRGEGKNDERLEGNGHFGVRTGQTRGTPRAKWPVRHKQRAKTRDAPREMAILPAQKAKSDRRPERNGHFGLQAGHREPPGRPNESRHRQARESRARAQEACSNAQGDARTAGQARESPARPPREPRESPASMQRTRTHDAALFWHPPADVSR